jgi:hypothetical protein
MMELDLLLVIYATNYHPALVIGGGKVGQATARALKQKDIPVHLLERTKAFAPNSTISPTAPLSAMQPTASADESRPRRSAVSYFDNQR